MTYGMVRVACASPALVVADCRGNAEQIARAVHDAQGQGVQVLVLPELCVTGYTCADLFLQDTLLSAATTALRLICDATRGTDVLFAVGLPVARQGIRYNAAAWVQHGGVLAVIPKTFVPTYGEFYERRWFCPAPPVTHAHDPQVIDLGAGLGAVPFGTDILLSCPEDPRVVVATEICEDLWVPSSPSSAAAACGATIVANLSASNEVVGKAAYRRMLVASHSAKTVSAYLYADACQDESTTDMVFAGHNIIASDGTIRAQSELFATPGTLTVADVDVEALSQERLRMTTFADSSQKAGRPYRTVQFALAPSPFRDSAQKIIGGVPRQPFVPAESTERSQRCQAVIALQAQGLSKRLRHVHARTAVIGLSGGLDSTLALLVTARAFDLCGLPRGGIVCVTMPCFGTTGRTYRNACSLARGIGATLKEVDIRAAVTQHFADIGQDPGTHDVTYENCQARERTQVLMDIANMTGGLVIGTGDLSELALGWCTYNGDQMSMYGVNSSIPKTLVRHLVSWFADKAGHDGERELSETLGDILDTPVSPELLPPQDGTISQKTEELVGPYELHDFFLYYMLRRGFSPAKIFFLARNAFCGTYSEPEIVRWLEAFYRRFFSQQFKRSCMPDGAKVGTVSLSPRGDWRMPSDASARLWLDEVARLSAECADSGGMAGQDA